MSQIGLCYPFSAILAQENMKKALLLNAINPKIGGVLIRGEKGTAKSIAVRALAQLLPEISIVPGCPFFCNPHDPGELCDNCASRLAAREELGVASRQVSVIDLPIGATEDRLVGTLDIESAIKSGEKHFEPGLLAAANRGILYIDEVNLLDDHLVDVLLDAAAMGRNYVEREGVSFSHPAQFILVGTMNPEEGELRPQLLDRFGLAVEVKGILDAEARAEIVLRRIAFEENPVAFAAAWEEEQKRIRAQIVQAKKLLPQVQLSQDMLKLIVQICLDFGVDGHRADITICKASNTLAAYQGRTEVNEEDVREAAELSLLHRRRRQPFGETGLDQKELEQSIQKWRDDLENQAMPEQQQSQNHPDTAQDPRKEKIFEPDSPHRVKPLPAPMTDRVPRSGAGRRSKSITSSKNGRYAGSTIPQGEVTDLAFDATLRAAAPFQARRRGETAAHNAVLIESHDIREKVREKKVGNLIMFVLDASGSMAAEERMAATKGAILSLLLDAYQRRDHVGMVVFRRDGAELVLPPTNSIELARKYLVQLPTGGRTPLPHGLQCGLEAIKEYLFKNKKGLPLLVLVSDGKANVSLNGGDPVDEALRVAQQIKAANIKSIVVDTEHSAVPLGLMRQLCNEMGGTYLRPEELKADSITWAVKDRLGYSGKKGAME